MAKGMCLKRQPRVLAQRHRTQEHSVYRVHSFPIVLSGRPTRRDLTQEGHLRRGGRRPHLGSIPPPAKMVANLRIDPDHTHPRAISHLFLTSTLFAPLLPARPSPYLTSPLAAAPPRRMIPAVSTTGGGNTTPLSSRPPFPSRGHLALLGNPAVSVVTPVRRGAGGVYIS